MFIFYIYDKYLSIIKTTTTTLGINTVINCMQKVNTNILFNCKYFKFIYTKGNNYSHLQKFSCLNTYTGENRVLQSLLLVICSTLNRALYDDTNSSFINQNLIPYKLKILYLYIFIG